MSRVPAAIAEDSSDELLAAAAQGGDRRALEILFLRHELSLRCQVARMIGDYDRVQDLVQECYIDLLRGIAGYDSARPFLPWMRAVCRHRVLREGRRLAADRSRAYEDIDSLLLDGPAGDDGQRLALVAALRRCLPQLRAQQRDWLRQHYVEGIGLADIGAVLGRSANAMAAALKRVRDRLRRCAEAERGAAP